MLRRIRMRSVSRARAREKERERERERVVPARAQPPLVLPALLFFSSPPRRLHFPAGGKHCVLCALT